MIVTLVDVSTGRKVKCRTLTRVIKNIEIYVKAIRNFIFNIYKNKRNVGKNSV